MKREPEDWTAVERVQTPISFVMVLIGRGGGAVLDTMRSWRSVEDAVKTLMECFSCVDGALEQLRLKCSDKQQL